ncbi:rho GTPase-activating protein 19 [Patella vulgata]|uniref:rho GTPase-activating protein 19 n=1 Tax=Patella vulgata TaxID=6465 RepID=UPI00217F270E|nr:rho GTPase-activating protein 19 [Patella vulgata]
MSNTIVRRRQTEAEKNINRLRNVMPNKYTELCLMHLSFLLDLDGSKLEDLGDTEPKQDNKKRGCSTPFSKKKEKTLFGSPITQGNIAQIYQLIEFLSRPENIRKEGIFRKCGNCNRQKLLKEWLIQGSSNLGLDDGTFSAHDSAVVLKNYLQDLPEPLLTEKHFQCYRQILDMGKYLRSDKEKQIAKEKQVKAIQVLILMLPRENALLLECVLDLLHRVSKVSENMMTANSLGTIFAPHLLCSRKMTALELHALSGCCTQITTLMIENAPQLFKIPQELAIDVSNFWKQMEDPASVMKTNSEKLENFSKSKQKNNSGPAINTVICYNDRQGQLTKETDTQVALAGLYAHVHAMPDSAKKKKLLKQFQRANRPSTPKSNKHSRSKTFGESLKKHFPVLHKHKRNDSNDPCSTTSGLAWAVTKPITIEESGNDKVTIISCGTTTTPCTPSTPRTNPRRIGPTSPAVHVVDMWQSPLPKSRKRPSDESNENIPKKESRKSPVTESLPVAEKEISFLKRNAPIKKILVFTPEHNKPVALVSPITQSVIKASKECQKAILTPRSRKPMQYIQSPPERESSI